MLNLNSSTLQAVADKALVDAAASPRWVAAIERALIELDSNPFLERAEHGGLIIGSPSGACYSSNGVCQCPSYSFGHACWHRAAARLVRLCDEYEVAANQRADQARLARKIAAARVTAQFNADLFA
jgi:hypothetical protein